MLYGSIRRNLYAHLSIHKMRWTLVFDYLFTPISTPKWHESIWFCMKFYEFTISKNLVTMRFYGLLLRHIDLWKKANLQRFPVSSCHSSRKRIHKISSYYSSFPPFCQRKQSAAKRSTKSCVPACYWEGCLVKKIRFSSNLSCREKTAGWDLKMTSRHLIDLNQFTVAEWEQLINLLIKTFPGVYIERL